MKQELTKNATETICILCGSFRSDFVMKKLEQGTSESIILQKCLFCNLVYQASWKLAYSSEDYHYYSDRISKTKDELYCPITESRYIDLLNFFKKHCNENKLLDFGCGEGHFIDVALKNGWDVSGIELSDPAVTICQNFELPVRKLDLFSSELKPNSYDIITMFEILEHLSQPGKAIARLEELLKPGGLLYLTTPNFASLDRKILGIQGDIICRGHLSYFTPKTLKFLIDEYSALNNIYIKSKNMSVSALRSLFTLKNNTLQKRTVSTPEDPGLKISELEPLLRQKIELSRLMKLGKLALNQGLSSLGWGATLISLMSKK